MTSSASSPLFIGALLGTLPGAAFPASEPKFEKLFTRPGVVTEGWVVRNWIDVSEPPEVARRLGRRRRWHSLRHRDRAIAVLRRARGE